MLHQRSTNASEVIWIQIWKEWVSHICRTIQVRFLTMTLPWSPQQPNKNLRNESLKSSPRCRGLASCVWPCPWYLGQCPNLVGKWRWCTVHRTQSDHELECSKSYHISMAFFEFRAFDSQENQAPLDSLDTRFIKSGEIPLQRTFWRSITTIPAMGSRTRCAHHRRAQRHHVARGLRRHHLRSIWSFEVFHNMRFADLPIFQGFLSFHLGAPNPSNPRHSILGQNPLQLEFGTQEFGAR